MVHREFVFVYLNNESNKSIMGRCTGNMAGEGGIKMHAMKMTDQVARHEIAGHEVVTYFSSIVMLCK